MQRLLLDSRLINPKELIVDKWKTHDFYGQKPQVFSFLFLQYNSRFRKMDTESFHNHRNDKITFLINKTPSIISANPTITFFIKFGHFFPFSRMKPSFFVISCQIIGFPRIDFFILNFIFSALIADKKHPLIQKVQNLYYFFKLFWYKPTFFLSNVLSKKLIIETFTL